MPDSVQERSEQKIGSRVQVIEHWKDHTTVRDMGPKEQEAWERNQEKEQK